jgi:hypothetical protein
LLLILYALLATDMKSACARSVIAYLEILVTRRMLVNIKERYMPMNAENCFVSGMHRPVLPHTLGRNASIDPLVEGTELGRKDCEFLLVLLVHLNVVFGKTFNLVNVFHLSKHPKRHIRWDAKW